MSVKEKLIPKTSSVPPADFPNIPVKIEALRKIWRKEILDFLDALPLVRHIVEPHLSRVLRKLESIIDPDELMDYCGPTEDGVRSTLIAEDIDVAVGLGSFEVFEQYPETQSPQEAFASMKQMYEPYGDGLFADWMRQNIEIS